MRDQRPGRFPVPPTEHQGTGLAPCPPHPQLFPPHCAHINNNTEYSVPLSFASVGSRGLSLNLRTALHVGDFWAGATFLGQGGGFCSPDVACL